MTTDLSSLPRRIAHSRRARNPLGRTKGWSRGDCYRKRGQDDTDIYHRREVSETGHRRQRNT